MSLQLKNLNYKINANQFFKPNNFINYIILLIY